MNTEKLSKESRALFMVWLKTLTDDDIDNILGIEKEKSLEDKLAQALPMFYDSDVPKKLAKIATEHFSSK